VEAVRILVRGRVQGVGYRVFAAREARRLGVRGTVRNRADGSVEVVAVADAAALAALRARLAAGPPGGRVEQLEDQRLDPVPSCEGFEIRP